LVTVEHVQSSVVVSKIVSKSTHTIDPDRSYWRKQTNKNAPADGQDVTNDSTHLSPHDPTQHMEPPWGIEPQTYALRAHFHALLAGSKPAFA
jgi:hypothetical protein